MSTPYHDKQSRAAPKFSAYFYCKYRDSRADSARSYIDQAGSLTPKDLSDLTNWRAALNTLDAIAGVVGVPVVSTLLAHGAVVYSQRRTRTLSLELSRERKVQIFFTLYSAGGWPRSDQDHPAVSTASAPKICRGARYSGETQIVAWDPEPLTLNYFPQNLVLQRTTQKVISATNKDTQTHLWPNFSRGRLQIDICAEGSYDTVPWTTSRDKQEHAEKLWLALQWDEDSPEFDRQENFILKCESLSRRGWVELPSYASNYEAGPLLDEWPSNWAISHNFNDFYPGPYLGGARYRKELEWPPKIPTTRLCKQSVSKCPRPSDYRDNSYTTVEHFISRYFSQFHGETLTAQALEMAMYFANEAILTTASNEELGGSEPAIRRGRPIYLNRGSVVAKHKKNLGAMLFITVLIGLQVFGLLLLMAFIYSTPTWTSILDADALAQIGAQIGEWGAPRPDLGQMSGVVGVDETRRNTEGSSVGLAEPQGPSLQSMPVHLSLGGEGVISRNTMESARANSNVT
ncbi:hypothetical protein F66182_1516 [Fusarium sp. NRRL 66182]|nr:hypothetical protein F66182_1516 [Fusarium sp. NRRL 66182]